MDKKSGLKLGFDQYEIREYWSKRAEYFEEDDYKPVCIFEAQKEMNAYFDVIQRNIFSSLIGKIPSRRVKTILEIGCGIGRWAAYIEKHYPFSFVGIDISFKMAEIAKKRVKSSSTSVMSANELGFSDGMFDLVFSITVLQHMPYAIQEKAVREMCRVTKKGGYILIIEDTRGPKERFNLFANPPSEWRRLFENEGCSTISMKNHKSDMAIALFSRCMRVLDKMGIADSGVKGIIKVSAGVESFLDSVVPSRYFSGVALLMKKVM
ncbi:MAG: methyltransferase domain-containing protein [Candidatus Methanofastidiosia archaeon]